MLWLSQPALRLARTPARLPYKVTTSVPFRAPTTAHFHQAPRHFESERRPRRPWTSEEVDLLFNLRQEKYSVTQIAAILQRSDNSVKRRLYSSRSTAAGTAHKWKPWSKQEDDELENIMAGVVSTATETLLAEKWNRTPKSVKSRLYVLRRKSNMIKKGSAARSSGKPWSQGEYDLAKRLRDEGKSAAYIGEALGRTGNSVRGCLWHRRTFGRPFNPQCFVSDNELATIERLDSQGFSLREIQKHMPHRGGSAIDRALRALPNRKPRLTRWTEEELIKLRKLYDEGKSVADILPYLPGRTLSACQQKVHSHIRQREKP